VVSAETGREEGRAGAREPFVVALTGGIAAGKSTVSRLFEELGVPVVDTDVIARELVRPGTPLLAEIEAQFGAAILDEAGELRRRELRRIILTDADRRAALEAILHPAILRESLRQVEQHRGAPYCIVVIPLLAEIGVPDWVDRVLVVEAGEATRIERLRSRDSMSHREAELSLKAQASGESRRAIADDRLVNEGGIDDLKSRVEALHRSYLRLAN
jgi:dephospho-CoA kinase